jgi:Leu/Phe-tRNA-protein transferase
VHDDGRRGAPGAADQGVVAVIPPIGPADLDERTLWRLVYPNGSVTHYWTDLWDADFYVALARAGFISIAIRHPDHGDLLLPEIQRAYAVLDWPELRVSSHVRRLRESGRLEEDGVELRVSSDCHAVLGRLHEQHERCWLIEPYQALVHELAAAGPRAGLQMHAVELWSTRHERLVAGELGYSIGRTYTSLSGFCSPGDPVWNHFGSLQLVLLGERLRDAGYAFWNLGHPHMDYKLELGARVLDRAAFLERWLADRDEMPERPL